MLHPRLQQLFTLSYYSMLIFGLLPSTLSVSSKRLRVRKVSKTYLSYSLCLTAVVILQFVYMLPRGIIDGYVKNNVVLQWNLVVSFALRLVVFLSCYALVWLRRQHLRRLYLDFLHNWWQHWQILQRVAGLKALNRMQLQLALIFQRQLCVNVAMIVCSLLVQYQLLGEGQLKIFLLKAVQMVIISAFRIGFCTLLLLLNHQFEAVLLSLRALSRGGVRSPTDLADLRHLAVIHSKWFQLARRSFDIYDLAIASVLINMFSANVNILYHAVQYGKRTIKSNVFGFIIGDALIAFNLLNTVLIMNLVDRTLNSCNDAGLVLRQFNNLRRINRESQLELELFMNQIRSNRLVYRICGCVELDRPAFLGYMASVLNNVLILMQFDLSRSQQKA